jgi:prevent-host-death family protein
MSVNVHEAKTHFSKLISRVLKGEEITIAKGGRPVARLIPVAPTQPSRLPGTAKGKIRLAPNFNAPLPKKVLKAFQG